MAALSAAARLTVPAAGPGYTPPGDARTRAVLGYLHANCGHCHHPDGIRDLRDPMTLRLSVNDLAVADTGVAKTAVNVVAERPTSSGGRLQIKSGDPAASAVSLRMGTRGLGLRDLPMPPLATEVVDQAQLDIVNALIAQLPP